jgi:uridine kinase
MEKLVMRDGFKIGGSANYVIENWENMRHASEELLVEGHELLDGIDEQDRERLVNVNARCVDKWIENKHYSPDRAEKFRAAAREKLYAQSEGGVKA